MGYFQSCDITIDCKLTYCIWNIISLNFDMYVAMATGDVFLICILDNIVNDKCEKDK